MNQLPLEAPERLLALNQLRRMLADDEYATANRPVRICLATLRVQPRLVINTDGGSHRRALFVVDCPYCGQPHLHGAGNSAFRYWRVSQCRGTEGGPYILCPAHLDLLTLYKHLQHEDRVFWIDDEDGKLRVHHAQCDRQPAK